VGIPHATVFVTHTKRKFVGLNGELVKHFATFRKIYVCQ